MAYLHEPVVGRRLVDHVDFASDEVQVHVLALIHQEELQGVRGLPQNSVGTTGEPVSVEHLLVRLPQRCDPGKIAANEPNLSYRTKDQGGPILHTWIAILRSTWQDPESFQLFFKAIYFILNKSTSSNLLQSNQLHM